MVFRDKEAVAKYLDTSHKRIMFSIDELWKKCEKEKWFETSPGLKDFLMWSEHEISRPASMLAVCAKDLRNMKC